MNPLTFALGLILLGLAIGVTIFTKGITAPFMLPVAFYGLNLMGVKTE